MVTQNVQLADQLWSRVFCNKINGDQDFSADLNLDHNTRQIILRNEFQDRLIQNVEKAVDDCADGWPRRSTTQLNINISRRPIKQLTESENWNWGLAGGASMIGLSKKG